MPLHIGFFYSTKRHANRWYSVLVTTNHPLCFVIQISSQGWKTTWKDSFIIFLSEEMEFVRDNLRDYSGVGPDLFDPPPGSYRISFFSLCTQVQSNGDHASCQRNQLMQQAWLSKNEKDYIIKSTRKLCRVILFAGIKEIFINTFNNSILEKKR